MTDGEPFLPLPDGGLAEEAELAFARGDISSAALLFQQLTEKYPDNSRFFFNLGSCLSNLGNHPSAIAAYKQALLRNPLDADSLYFLGLSYLDCHLPEEAEKFFTCCLAVDPDYVRVHSAFAHAAHQLGNTEQAIAYYRRALDADADDETAAHMLASLSGEPTERAPDRYVRSLFDHYARSFEQSLTGIGYEIPRQLRTLFDRRFGSERRFQKIVDLGCGTGLSGGAFCDLTDRMIGVDLSARMLAEAEAKGIYHQLRQQELVAYLEECGEKYDLFLLTDVLVYLGNLAPLFGAICRRALPDSLLLFSVEKSDHREGYQLRSTGRYAHSRQYLEELIGRNRLHVEARCDAGIRKQNDSWIDGEIYILSCP